MTRLVLIWLAAVVAVNCELFPKEDAQENKVVPVDAYDAPTVQENKVVPVDAYDAPTVQENQVVPVDAYDAPTVQENKVVPVDAYDAPTVLNEGNHMLFKAKETRDQFLAKWNRQLYQDKEEEKGRRKREGKSNNVRKQTNKEGKKERRKKGRKSNNVRKQTNKEGKKERRKRRRKSKDVRKQTNKEEEKGRRKRERKSNNARKQTNKEGKKERRKREGKSKDMRKQTNKEGQKERRKRGRKSKDVRKQTNKEEEKGRRKRRRKSKNVKNQTKKGYKNKANDRKKVVTLSDFESNTIDMDDLCKKTLTLDAATEFTLISPARKKKCKGMVVKAKGGETLSMKCSLFELDNGGCKQESLTIKGSGKSCNTNAPDLSGKKSLKFTYKTKSLGSSEGFECLIRASGGSTGGTGQICDECGVADINPGRIVGGQDADENEYPWMLSMDVKIGGGRYSCGASLIAPSWVLTAQHCVEGADASDITITYGTQKMKADEVILHPDYNTRTLDNDIALVKLKTPVPVDGKNVLPVCLASSPPKVGDPAVVTGWGALEYNTGDYPDNLQEVEVDIISNKECGDKYAVNDFDITDSMICAARKNKDACSGDSGGPMIVKNSDGFWEEVGIVSFGEGCADPNFPGGYARVDYFFTWITSKVSGCV